MIKIVQEARDTKKAIKLPILINPVMGKQLAQYSTFRIVSWGKPTPPFIRSTKCLNNNTVEKIMDQAKEFTHASCYRDEGYDDVDPDDEHANLVEGLDGTLCDSSMS